MHSIQLQKALVLMAAAGLMSCGSAKPTDGTPGSSHSRPTGNGDSSDIGDSIDSSLGASVSDAGATPTGPVAPVTFVIRNDGKGDLSLNMDKGWGAVIGAYSGEPPNAKSILLFPKHCTAACDSSPEEICPYCPEPERVKDIKEAEKHDEVAPGDTREVPWDGVAFSYKGKKAKGTRDGKKVKCQCFNASEPEPATYKIRVCGLRKTQTAKARSAYPCAEATLTLPVESPIRVELNIGEE